MGRLKRWWYLSKLLTITITSFNFFKCPVKLQRNLKLKFRSKFNHDFTNHGYLHSAVWKALYNFKIKRAQEARHNQFFFQNVQNNEIFHACFVSNWKYDVVNFYSFWPEIPFWANLIQKMKIVSLSWNITLD